MNNIIALPPKKMPISRPILYPFYRPIEKDETCFLALLPGGGTKNKWLDESCQEHHGIVTGCALTNKGRYGVTFNFDEVDDHIIITDFIYGPSFTICFWFRLTDNAGNFFQYIFSHGVFNVNNSVNIYIRETGAASANVMSTNLVDDDDVADATALDINDVGLSTDWQFYSLTVGSFGSRVYLDGIERNTASKGGAAFNPITDIYLGAREDLNVDRLFGGNLDSVYIFNRALNATEIKNIYEQGV